MHPATVVVTLYVPAIARVAPGRVGFCSADAKAAGPVQEYVAPATKAVLKVIVFPVQTGLLDVGAGVAGIGLTTTVVVPKALVHPPTVTVTEYVPEAAIVANGIDGF